LLSGRRAGVMRLALDDLVLSETAGACGEFNIFQWLNCMACIDG